MIRVACVGITVMDRIYYVEGLPTESGKYVAKIIRKLVAGQRRRQQLRRQGWGRRSILLVA